MRAFLFALVTFPSLGLAEPNCEQVYWGEVFDGALGTDYGLLPLDRSPEEGTQIAARGADQEDPEAIDYCPKEYTVLKQPRLQMMYKGGLSDIPDDWGKNSQYFEALVVHDPDGAGTSSVTVLWDTGDTLVPLRSVFYATQVGSRKTQTVMSFDEIATMFPDGDGLLFVHDLYGPELKTYYMRWSFH